MKDHEKYAEEVKNDIKNIPLCGVDDLAIYVIQKQIDLVDEISVQSMAEVVVRKHKLLTKAIEHLKQKI
jgi:hypothetical protein